MLLELQERTREISRSVGLHSPQVGAHHAAQQKHHHPADAAGMQHAAGPGAAAAALAAQEAAMAGGAATQLQQQQQPDAAEGDAPKQAPGAINWTLPNRNLPGSAGSSHRWGSACSIANLDS